MKFPSKSWSAYEDSLKCVAENRCALDPDDAAFLAEIGFVSANDSSDSFRVTPTGRAYFDARFINCDDVAADEVLGAVVWQFPAVSALIQVLHAMPEVTRDSAESVLRSYGFGEGLTDRKLGSLLMLMHRACLIAYNKRLGTFSVLVHPVQEDDLPPAVFVAPETPFANRVWLRRVLGECKGFIWWFDKHFMPQALEVLWEAADGGKISEVRVTSLLLAEHRQKRSLRAYRDLRDELRRASVSLQWRIIEPSTVRDVHDRWIIGASEAWNVPNVNAILSGQRSELSRSIYADELRQIYDRYWNVAVPVDSSEGPAVAS